VPKTEQPVFNLHSCEPLARTFQERRKGINQFARTEREGALKESQVLMELTGGVLVGESFCKKR